MSSPRAGFTLLEMMMAIGASLAVIFIAVAGLRTTTAAITQAKKLDVSTGLLAAGVQQVFNEIDFWDNLDSRKNVSGACELRRSYDVPRAVTVSPLPGDVGNITLGLPFSPFNTATAGYPAVWKGVPRQDYGNGWQDHEMHWAATATNRHSWINFCALEASYSDARFGRSAIVGMTLPLIYANTQVLISSGGATSTALGGAAAPYGSVMYAPGGSASNWNTTENLDPDGGWMYDQINGVSNALGWYGMIDYLPASTIFSVVRPYLEFRPVTSSSNPLTLRIKEATDAQGRPVFWATGGRPNNYNSYDSSIPYYNLRLPDCLTNTGCPPVASDALTAYGAFSIISPNYLAPPTFTARIPTADLVFYHRNHIMLSASTTNGGGNLNDLLTEFQSGTGNFCWAVDGGNYSPTLGSPYSLYLDNGITQRFIGRSTQMALLMGRRPADWPDVSYSVTRVVRSSRFSNQCKVSWTDPLTGECSEVRFNVWGTTLRGARRQRGALRPSDSQPAGLDAP